MPKCHISYKLMKKGKWKMSNNTEGRVDICGWSAPKGLAITIFGASAYMLYLFLTWWQSRNHQETLFWWTRRQEFSLWQKENGKYDIFQCICFAELFKWLKFFFISHPVCFLICGTALLIGLCLVLYLRVIWQNHLNTHTHTEVIPGENWRYHDISLTYAQWLDPTK